MNSAIYFTYACIYAIYLYIIYVSHLHDVYFCRLKELLKLYGRPGTKLKRKKASSDDETPAPKVEKVDYITALIDAMRLNEAFGNDYKLMAQFLIDDSNIKKGKKGFGSKK